MTDPQPAEATATIASQSIELRLTGKPDVKNKWGAGSIRPVFVVFTYLPEGIRAHLYGVWVREDGEATDAPCDQEYRIGDSDEWPDWMAKLAIEYKPADRAPAVDRAALRDRIARTLAEVTVGHKAFITVDVRAESPRADAVLAALPVPADRATVLRAAADKLPAYLGTQGEGTDGEMHDTTLLWVADLLRGMADETQQFEAVPSVTEYRIETRDGDTWRALGLPYEIDIARRIRAEYLRGYPEAQVRILRCTRTAVVVEPAVGAQQPKEA